MGWVWLRERSSNYTPEEEGHELESIGNCPICE
jgi:hypothetical protein